MFPLQASDDIEPEAAEFVDPQGDMLNSDPVE
jgi:hypothetical protein